MFKKILVPTDGSPLSDMVIEKAMEFAREHGARLCFFCAGQANPAIYFGAGAIFDEQAPNHFREMAKLTAQDIVEKAQRKALDARIECDTLILFGGAPYEAIIEAAQQQECDLIFMASHGRRGVNALLLGSETQKVLTHSRIPVLVYR